MRKNGACVVSAASSESGKHDGYCVRRIELYVPGQHERRCRACAAQMPWLTKKNRPWQKHFGIMRRIKISKPAACKNESVRLARRAACLEAMRRRRRAAEEEISVCLKPRTPGEALLSAMSEVLATLAGSAPIKRAINMKPASEGAAS